MNLPKRPHSTNIPGPRAGKKSILVTSTHASNQKLNQNTLETDAEDDKLNKTKKVSSFNKRVGNNVTNYNFYAKSNNNNGSTLENDLSDDMQNFQLRSIMFQSDSKNILDGMAYPQYNSLNMSAGFIEPPPNVYTDHSLGEEQKSGKKHKNNLSYIIQSHSSKTQQTNAFHTKIPPKKQNQTQLLIKYINSEGQSHNCKQIEKANLIQQRHFYDDLFLGSGLKPQEHNEQNNKEYVKKQKQHVKQQLINVSNFNKSFYIQVNVNKQQRSKRNSIGSTNIAVDDNGKLTLQTQPQTITEENDQNQNQNQNQSLGSQILQQQFMHKASFPGRKLSIVNKETLNMLVKKLSQSMHQENKDNKFSVASLNNSQDVELTQSNLMASAPQSRMIRASQTSKNSFFTRNNSISNNRAQTAGKKSRNEQRQPCVKGISIKKYYQKNSLNSILTSQDNNELSLSVVMPQKQNSMNSELTQRDYQHMINHSQNQSMNLSFQDNKQKSHLDSLMQNNHIHNNGILDENLNDINVELQDKNLIFLQSQAECYNSSNPNVDQQINNYIRDVKKTRINSENDRRRRESNFLIQSQSHRSREGTAAGGNQAQTSFNFYAQNQYLNSTGTNFKSNFKQSQLVEHGNHIERKLSNMSQDSHPYLETLVFGEFGTLETAVAKSNTKGISDQFNKLNDQNDQICKNQEEFQQQYPLSSRYLENLAKSKSRNLNKKQIKQNKFNGKSQQKNLSINRESETVADLISYEEKQSNFYKKKRCASAREELYDQVTTQRSEDLKEKFLKNLNLRGQRQSSQEDLRSAGDSQGSIKDITQDGQKTKTTLNRDYNSQNELMYEQEQQKNSSSHNLDEINGQSSQIRQSSQFKANSMSLNKRKLSNDYGALIKAYEKDLATRTIELADQQQEITPVSLKDVNQTTSKINQNDRKSIFNVKENSQIAGESSECYSILKQVYNNQGQRVSQEENGMKIAQTMPTQVDSQCRQISSSLNTDHFIISTQNTAEINMISHKRQQNNQQEFNGMFMPYRQEDISIPNSINPSQLQAQKIIHSNFPQKINSKFLNKKNLTNSQIYSFLLQKQSAASNNNQSLDSSMIQINQKDISQNNSQKDINRLKKSQYSNQIRYSSLNNSMNCNISLPQEMLKNKSPPQSRINGSRPNSMSFNTRNRKQVHQKLDTEETLQPWNDYTYVKYF